MYAEDKRETDTKVVVLIAGRLILSDRLHAQNHYMLKRKITIGKTDFMVYACSATRIEKVDELVDLNMASFQEWANYRIQ